MNKPWGLARLHPTLLSEDLRTIPHPILYQASQPSAPRLSPLASAGSPCPQESGSLARPPTVVSVQKGEREVEAQKALSQRWFWGAGLLLSICRSRWHGPHNRRTRPRTVWPGSEDCSPFWGSLPRAESLEACFQEKVGLTAGTPTRHSSVAPPGSRPWRALVPPPKAGLAQSTASYPRTRPASRAPPPRSGPSVRSSPQLFRVHSPQSAVRSDFCSAV